MKLIKGFDCIQKEIYGNGTEKILSNKIVKIQTELIRPSLIFKNKANKVIDLNSIKQFTYSKQLRSNALYPDEYFSANELKFLSEIYAFSVVESNRHKGFFHSKLSINPLYTSPGTIEF
ncbi:MAG: hypothetical protein I4O51_08135, partial [Flavobacterium micromati]|nr:hypothetical protein [Flavobacterium micromati]